MMGVKQRIEELRQQPEHVRMRVTTLATLVSGAVIALLWLVVLLPLQLKISSKGDNGADKNIAQEISSILPKASNNIATEQADQREPKVGGLRTENQLPLIEQVDSPVLPTPAIDSEEQVSSFSPTVSPTSSPESTDLITNEVSPLPETQESLAPVKITK